MCGPSFSLSPYLIRFLVELKPERVNKNGEVDVIPRLVFHASIPLKLAVPLRLCARAEIVPNDLLQVAVSIFGPAATTEPPFYSVSRLLWLLVLNS